MAAASLKFLDLISRQRGGLFFDLARGGLLALSMPYLAAVTLRNAFYDYVPGRVRKVDRPVISVGNITVGGSGKTPMVAWIAQRLIDQRRKPALLLRGYKAAPIATGAAAKSADAWRSQSDEALVLKRLSPSAAVIIDPDRVAGAKRAIAGGADAIVLDDGFQHRRIARDLDIVLIDATRPFGYGHLLPRGLLRESTRSLRRASLIVLTRSDEVDESSRTLLMSTLRRVSGGKPVAAARHKFSGFVDVNGAAVPDAEPSAMRAVIFAGIANFESFRRGLEKLGVKVLAAYQYPDHHAYSRGEIDGLPVTAAELDANVVITTEKDAVKLEGRWTDPKLRLLSPRVGIDMDAESAGVVENALSAVIGSR